VWETVKGCDYWPNGIFGIFGVSGQCTKYTVDQELAILKKHYAPMNCPSARNQHHAVWWICGHTLVSLLVATSGPVITIMFFMFEGVLVGNGVLGFILFCVHLTNVAILEGLELVPTLCMFYKHVICPHRMGFKRSQEDAEDTEADADGEDDEDAEADAEKAQLGLQVRTLGFLFLGTFAILSKMDDIRVVLFSVVKLLEVYTMGNQILTGVTVLLSMSSTFTMLKSLCIG
jgi:hypothetical protein